MKIQHLLILPFLMVSVLLNAQTYTYKTESFEENVWGNAASSFNVIKSATGHWKVAKNNVQSTAVAAQDGSYSLVFATKTIALTTPRLENGAGTLTFYAIKSGTRAVTIESSADSTTWTNLTPTAIAAQSTWTKHTLSINSSSVRYLRFTTNSNGGFYLDNILITDASPAGIVTTTLQPEKITQTSLEAKASIANNSAQTITACGFCYNKTGSPDINSSKVELTGTNGNISATVSGLEMGTTYYVKAYAQTATGISYGLSVPVTTRAADAPVAYWYQPFDNTAHFPDVQPTSPLTINVPDQGDWIYSNTYKSSNALYIPDGSAYAIRMPKSGSYIITPLLSDGVTDFSFTEGRGGRDLTVYTSTNSGSTWTLLQTVTTVRGEMVKLQIKSAVVNRIKITNASGSDADVDNLSATVFPTGTLPALSTNTISNILKNSALCGGNITSDGGKILVERGVCWSTVTTPIVADNKVVSGTGTGVFETLLTDLPAGTTIYARAYAISRAGTAYGEERTFTTLPATVPVLTTTVSTDIKAEYAVSGGVITDNGGAPVTQKGICWNTAGSPDINGTKTDAGTGNGNFSAMLTQLSANTKYYYRAYATNIAGTAYGQEESLTTVALGTPEVTTAAVSTLFSYKAMAGGEVVNDGNAYVTRGVCWNTTGNPTTADTKKSMGNGKGIFSEEISGLTENTRYFVRAYVTGSFGTIYGNEVSFDTPVSNRLSKPIGYGRFTTGGGTPTPENTVIVKTAAELSAALNGSMSVILVSGTISTPRISAAMRNKTVIGLPGARLINLDQTAEGSGILHLLDGSRNVIIQNLIFEGPGAYDADGWDLLSNKGTYNLWVDHCDFQDGMDDCFDNTNNSDSITVSWCKFSYLKPAKAGGSGGSDDHRFATLIGGSDSDVPTDGYYNITWQNCWWANGVKSRMVRGRNVDIHMLNCYWNSSNATDVIGLTAGTMGCKVYVEGGHFDLAASATIADLGSGAIAIKFVDCINGKTDFGVVPKPTYEYSAQPSADIKSTVPASCGAGATLIVSATGEVFSSCPTTPYLSMNEGSGSQSQEVFEGNAIKDISFNWGGSATDAVVSALPAGLTVNKNASTKTIVISGIPTAAGNFTISTVAPSGLPAVKQCSVAITQIAPPTLVVSGNTNQMVDKNNAISEIVYTWGGGATDVSWTNLPDGIIATKNTQNKSLTLSGIPAGSKQYSVTTIGGSGNAVVLTGNIQIRYSSTKFKIAYFTNPASLTYINDTRMLPALKNDPNFEVTEVSAANASNDYSPYNVVIFTEVAASEDPGVLQLKGLNKPMIMMKVHSYKVAGGAWSWASAGYGQSDVETTLTVTDKLHPMFKDVEWTNTNQVQMLTAVGGNKGLTYMDPAQFKNLSGSIKSLGYLNGQTAQVSIFEAPAGTSIAGTLLQKKLIQIGLNSNSYAFLTDNAVSIVKNACLYLTDALTGISEQKIADNSVRVFPTIATTTVTIESDNVLKSIQLIALDGRICSLINTNNFSEKLNVQQFNSGMYLLKVKTEKGTSIQKIEIKR